jgi:hypothetical protein
MAKSVYRLTSAGRWCAASGNAIFAVTNPPGSGKKVTIEAVEMNPLTYNAAGGVALNTAQIPMRFDVGFCTTTADGPVQVTPVKTDSAFSDWPAAIKVSGGATVASVVPFRRVALCKSFTGAGVPDLTMLTSRVSAGGAPGAGQSGGNLLSSLRGAAATPKLLRAGESFCIVPVDATNALLTTTQTLRVKLMVSLDFGTEAFYVVDFMSRSTAQDLALVTINNPLGSGRILRIVTVGVEEVGTWDSPYLRMVPVGALDASAASDTGFNLVNSQCTKLDSTYPALNSAHCKVWQDVPILPQGVPQSYISEGSAGSPKGYNYLHTKDFDGPQHSVLFPEFLAACGANADGAGMAAPQGGNRWKCDSCSKIVLREGDGLALVSSAETATAAPPVGVSGWIPFDVSITFSVDVSYQPLVTLNFDAGLQSGGTGYYRLYFASTPSGDYATTNAVTVNDALGNAVRGTISGSSVSFSFDYNGNSQGGRTPATNASVVLVCGNSGSAKVTVVTGTITNATTVVISAISSADPGYEV